MLWSWRLSPERRMRVALGSLLLVGLGAGVVHAQLGYIWTFDQLMARADCVIIASYVRTNDTGRHTTHPELQPGYPVVELESSFNVLTVLKPCGPAASALPRRFPEPRGDDVGTIVRLKHYKIDRERLQGGLLNGGTMLDFSLGGGSYLLFLKSGTGPVYEPVSGHVFPTDSVYRLSH